MTKYLLGIVLAGLHFLVGCQARVTTTEDPPARIDVDVERKPANVDVEIQRKPGGGVEVEVDRK